MRSIRDWTGREGLIEANAISGQAVESGGFDLFIAVTMDVVSPQSVDGD